MDLFVIRGGRPLAGRVAVGGSKNATLPIMAASLMIDGTVTLSGVPDLTDVTTLSRVLESLGVSVRRDSGDSIDRGRLRLRQFDESRCIADYDLVRRMRASICVLGPLLAKRGRAVVSLPGGCNIGDRPIDVHLRGLAALGADLQVERGYVVATSRRLCGAVIDLAGPRGPTVTGTANVLAAAVLARGRSVLTNVAREPEIVDLIRFLTAAGARIDGAGTSVLEIEGVDALQPVQHRVISDRIEAATLMMASAVTGGAVILDGVPVDDLSQVTSRLVEAGVPLEVEGRPSAGGATVRVSPTGSLRPMDIVAAPSPGFPTDLQAQWTALMTQAEGRSRIRDDVFPNRFLHVAELARLGADVSRSGSTATICGRRTLRGTNVMASDLRASAALVLAALAAEGETVVRRIYHLDRGYERLDAKLVALGANVVRRADEAAIAVPPPTPA